MKLNTPYSFRINSRSVMKRFLIILALSSAMLAEKIMKFYKLDYLVDHKLVANATYSLKVPQRNKVLASIDGIIIREIRNVSVHYKNYKFSSNEFKPFLIDEWVNLCRILKSSGITKYYSRILLEWAGKFGNAIRCNYEVCCIK